jgi:hypothetical protein
MTLLRGAAWLMTVGALGLGCGDDRVACECPAAPPRGCVYTGRPGCACAAMVCSDVGPLVDAVIADRPRDVGTDARPDVSTDAGTDAGFDAGFDAGTDAGFDAGTDAGFDAGFDAGTDAGLDAGADAGADAPGDGARDGAGADVPLVCELTAAALRRACVNSDECRVGIFTVDRCGNARAVGFNASSRDAFEALRARCGALFGGPRPSGCPPAATVVDDMTSAPDDSRIGVACVAGLCTTRLIP